MTTSNASLVSVFVVLLGAGRYDDYNQTIVRTFSDRNAAENFVHRKNDAIQRVVGLFDAMELLLTEWDKSHPAPPGRYNNDDTYSSNVNWSEEAEEAHHALRSAERERFYSILGLEGECEKLKICDHDIQDSNYFFVESKLDGDSYEDL